MSKVKSSSPKTTTKSESPIQKLSATKGRAMLEWYGKRAPKSIEWFPAQEKEVYGDSKVTDWNALFWGDNKQVLAHLLKEYRGKVDLIYIDPPFDSKADYIKKIQLNGQNIHGVEQNVIEEMQYTDMWEKDEYLQFMYERLVLMRELLSDKGSIYLHCDWHKNSHLRLVMDEVFGEDNIVNEIVWGYRSGGASKKEALPRKHDTILFYRKNNNFEVNSITERQYLEKSFMGSLQDEQGRFYVDTLLRDIVEGLITTVKKDGSLVTFNTRPVLNLSSERTDYPTQKPKGLLELLITVASKEGDLVMDCFMGSGTTCAVAQSLGRRWIGCDINKGAIIATTERLNKIIGEQVKEKKTHGGLNAFKIFNVNHYDVFNNNIQARELLIQAYKIEELSRGDFDGTLGSDYVKIISPNRVLGKMDIVGVIDAIKKNKDLFIIKKVSKQKDATFENKVIVICSGAELDVRDFVKNENNTGVEIEIRDIQIDKKELDFKKPTEAVIAYTIKGSKLTVNVKDYYSPLLMKRLELENEGRLSAKERVSIFDYRQAIEHVVIDVNYGEGQKKGQEIAFNAEIFAHKEKKNELVDVSHEYTYDKRGTYTVAVKIVDVLGEEYFETHKITIK
ncbi:site-specific DNA-methyltransferase [Patescibacteria group bacterium]|nr:MAG: site-specific DNA-methyltransferase [Patescibacteria group bacterium]